MGVYKSLHQLLDELLCSDRYQQIYDEYRGISSRKSSVDKVLPKIKLKYHQERDKNVKSRDEENAKCFYCGNNSIIVGGILDAGTANQKIVCEDCVITQYQEKYGFESREIAEARRRRMFDVGYLFDEMLLDKYLKEKGKTIDGLRLIELETIYAIAKEKYNDISREDKVRFEELEDQRDIEVGLAGVIAKIEL